MISKYTNYTLQQLLEDNYFLESAFNPTPSSIAYWDELLAHGVIEKEIFEQARQTLSAVTMCSEVNVVTDERLEQLWGRIQNTNSARALSRKRVLYLRIAGVAAAAAMVVCCVSFAFMHRNDNALNINGVDIDKIVKAEMSSDISLVMPEHQVTLKGDSATLDYSGGDLKIGGQRADRNIIESNNNAKQQDAQVFNQLVVPFGKRSSLILPDGTKVWVNAGTRVIYPVAFAENRREIYVDGEIYLDVVSNPKWPFVIKTDRMNIKVLGTSFNVMAYSDQEAHSVVLVKGSVEIDPHNGQPEVIKPNQMYYAVANDHSIQSVDVDYYVSWKDGNYHFRNERLDVILSKLSRYCGVKIVCPASGSSITCSGTLLLMDDIKKLLDGICQTVPMSYKIENDTYIFYSEP